MLGPGTPQGPSQQLWFTKIVSAKAEVTVSDPKPGCSKDITLAFEPQLGPSTGPQGVPGPSRSGTGKVHKEMPLPPRPADKRSVLQEMQENLIRNTVAEALADLSKGRVQQLWDIRDVGMSPSPQVAPVRKLLRKLTSGPALSQEELLDIRMGYIVAIRAQVDKLMEDSLDNAKQIPAYQAVMEVQWPEGLTPPCPTCRRTDKVEATPATTGKSS
jgi:hypothetical protein